MNNSTHTTCTEIGTASDLPNFDTPPEDADGICWADQVGDRWEAEGHDPGRIWESQLQLSQDCFAGVMVLAKGHCAPGKRPKRITDILRAVAVIRRGIPNCQPEEIELVTEKGYRPVLMANWARIQPTLG